mmetsp:Transcript_23333/g.41280  ORF Transcript_23333/g.41280 Transcript_23333/m.41280 type:complete len:131 (-) Transcript_23333:349-741(-)
MIDFCKNHKESSGSKERWCFDLDSLMTAPKTPGEYDSCEILPRIQDFLNARYNDGYYIIIQSSRGMELCGYNKSIAIGKFAEISLRQLREFKVKYHEVSFDKPAADFFIDDKGLCALDDLEKSTGYYNFT